jgi:CRP-like cAMP-binding protein
VIEYPLAGVRVEPLRSESFPVACNADRAAERCQRPAKHSARQNHLLAALAEAEFERLAEHVQLLPIPLGEVLYESGGQLPYVYFHTTSIVLLLYVFQDGASAEITAVGDDGIISVSGFIGR